MIKIYAARVHVILFSLLFFPLGFNYSLFADNQASVISLNKYNSNNYKINHEKTEQINFLTSSSSSISETSFNFLASLYTVDLYIHDLNVNKKKVAVKDQIKLNYHIKNAGNVYKGEAYLGIYFSKDDKLDKNDINVKYLQIDINNHNINGNVYVTAPDLDEGKYFLIAKIDDMWGKSAIEESDELNNTTTFEKPIEIYVQPSDIQATITNVSADYNYLVVNYTLANLTQYGVGAWDAKIYLSTDQSIDADDRVVASIKENNIETYLHPYSSLGLHINEVFLFSSEYIPAGDYYILIDFNASRSLAEFDYNNNIGKSNLFTIEPYEHSLRIDEVHTGEKIMSSDASIPLDLDWTNDGKNSIDGLYLELKVQISQAGNSEFSFHDQWVWLSSGDSETIDLDIDMPKWISGGEALLTISSDYSNTFERKIDIIPDYEVAKIVIENLRQTYDGDKKKVKVTTEPQDLKVQVTYNGSAELPVKTGEYLVQAQVVDHMYKGQAEELFTIEAAAAKVKFEKSSVVYDGQPKEIKVITEPKDLPFEILYEGEKEIPVDAGKYSVEVKITDPNYQGSATTEFNILPMEVTVSFSDLEHIFDGETKAATITTTPDNLDFSTIYYDLDTVENMPINAGKYLVNVVGNQPNYKISAWASLKVSKAEANFLINKSSFDYDGSIKKPEITSSPEEINFKIAYFNKDTIEMDPVNAGSYLLKVEATDKNYEGAFWASFQIMPAVAEIKTEYLNSVYTGTVPKISYTTQPADLKLSYNFYDQDTLAAEPINAGKYLVKAVIIDQNYTGEAWDEINIAPAVINFSFANSRVEFTGTTRAITVIPSLPDIDYKVTYWQDDKEVDPIETGKYQVQVTSWDHNYTGFAETTFVIKPAKLSFNFDQLIEEYTGNIISIKLTTEPADVAFTVEYFDLDTNAILPLEAGKYLVKASGSDKNYTGYAWSIFEVTPAAADIIFDQLTHKYDGNAKKAIVYTNPAGLNVRVQYNGQNTLPVKAGTYEISAVVEDQSFTGNEIASLKIEKAEAEVFVSDLVFADNEPEISVTTMPSGLNYQVSYVIDGDTTSAIPAEPGEYKIIIEIEDDNFQGRLVSSMIITGGLATDNEDIFQVYPNPVSDILNFNILENEMKVQLMDLNGKLVKDWYLLGEKSIDISPVPRGNYFIAIQAGKRTYTKRIIKL